MTQTDVANPTWDPEVGHPRRRQILAIECLCLVIVVMAVSSLNVAIPTILEDLKPSSTQLLWIVDAYALVFAGLLLLAGAIGDRFGRKGALLGGLAVFGLGTLAASRVNDPNLLIVMRSIMGLGAAFVMPATLSIVTSVFPPRERPKAIATWAGFAGAGSALGPLLGGLMVENYGWASVFLVNVPIVMVTMVLVAWKVPTSRSDHAHKLDVVGAVFSVAALGSLLFGIIQGPDQGWGSPIVVGAFVLSIVFGVTFVLYELHTTDPMLDPRFFRIPSFRAGTGVIVAIFFGMFGMFFVMAQYLQLVRGYSPLLAGVATLPSAVTLILVTPRSPLLVARFGARRVIVTGMVLVATGFFIFSVLKASSPYLLIAVGLVIMATGMGFAMAPASTAIVSSLPMNKAGVASAVNDVTREVGGALGIAVMGTILTSRFTSAMSGHLPSGIPDSVREGATTSIAGALAIAEQVPKQYHSPIVDAAHASFTDGMRISFLVSTVVLLLMAAVASRSVPKDMQVTVGH